MAAMQAPVLARRYVLYERLGSGGMGVVYRAYDRLYGQEVALKRIVEDASAGHWGDSTDGNEFRASLAREFKLASTLRHPNIVQMLDYGFDEAHEPYFTMELLAAPRTLLEACTDRSLEYRLDLFVQMLQALAYVHRRGIIHHDLKPANVLVVRDEVKLLDFGLAKLYERAHSDDEHLTAGTLAYMAPEILAGVGGDVTSDLYAAGMMAYEIFAGGHPFTVHHAPTLIHEIMNVVPDLNGMDVPIELAFVIWRMLAKDPNDRYQSAVEVIRAINRTGIRQYPVESSATRESFLQASRLVSREAEIQYLITALRDAEQTHGRLILIGGESGVGKSRLLDELRTLAMVRGIIVIRSQASEIHNRPYDLWQPVLRWLCLMTSQYTEEDLALLSRLVPDLNRLIEHDLAYIAPPEMAPEAFAQALVRWMVRVVVASTTPMLMLLDDLQWVGSESLRLLLHLKHELPQLPLLIVGTYRDNEADRLQEVLAEAEVLKLPRLDAQGIEALGAAMLGQAGRRPQVVELLRRESEGNVFFAIEVVRVLAAEVDQLENIGLTTLPASVFAGSVRQVMLRRLRQISEADRAALQLAAVMGRRIDLDVLVAAIPTIDREAWLTTCANALIIEVEEQQWRFVHDKLREALLGSLTREQWQALHARVAQAYESHFHAQPDYARTLAYHWGMAGHPQQELRYALLAAQQMLRAGAYNEADQMLQRCLELLPQATATAAEAAQAEAEVRQWIGELCLARGQYAQATQEFAAMQHLAHHHAQTALEARALRMLGVAAVASNDLRAALQHYNAALALVELQDVGARSDLLNRIGDVYFEYGDQEAAISYYQEAKQMERAHHTPWAPSQAEEGWDTPAQVVAGLAAVLHQPEPDAARTLYQAATSLISAAELLSAYRILAFLAQWAATPEVILDEVEAAMFTLQPQLPPNQVDTVWEQAKYADLQGLVNALRQVD